MESIFDPVLMATARHEVKRAAETLRKQGFVDTATAGGGAGAGAPPGMDPAMSAAGGVPGMPMGDPSGGGAGGMPMGGDPSGGMGGGGGGLTEDRVLQLIQQSQQAGTGGGGGAGAQMGANGQPKKKVDVGTELYQIKKLLILQMQRNGEEVPPDILLGDPVDDPHAPPEQAQQDPASAGFSGGSAISPIQPLQAASPALAAGGGSGGGGGGDSGGSKKSSSWRNPGNGIDGGFLNLTNSAMAITELIRAANRANQST